MTASQSRELS